MANASAFGFSGFDPVGSYFEGSLNGYFDKKSEQRAYERQLALMEAQYSYAQRYAENTPSWTVKGLRAAGLNPILAVANGVHTSAQAPSVPSASSHRSPINSKASVNVSGLLPFDRRMAVQNADAQTLAAQAADKQADAALLKAQTDRGESAHRIAKMLSDVRLQDLEHKQRKVSNFQTPIVRDADSMVKRLINATKDAFSVEKDIAAFLQDDLSSYLSHGPKAESFQVRHSDIREKREIEREEKSWWKTRKSIDGQPIYRKRGDVGGNMHMYR